MTIAFTGLNDKLNKSTLYVVFNIAGTVFFIIDIFINLNTSYYDHDGDEIKEKKKIIKHYIGTSFTVDLVSSIPIEFITDNKVVRIINMLKIIRLMRIRAIIDKMNVDEELKSTLRILVLLMTLVFTMHIVGCTWYFVCDISKEWIPPLDFAWAGIYPKIYRFYSKDDFYMYSVSYYNAVLFLGGNEMGPRTSHEIIVCTVILILMAIFNAALFGDMAVLTEMSGRKQAEFQEQIDIANTAMN